MTVCLVILAPAGGVLALGLPAVGAAAPALAVAASRRAARATAPARGELGATVTDLLSGAADLHAFGAQDAALAAAAEADVKLTTQARRSAAAMGLGSGLISGLTGLTVWAVLVLGVAAVGQGRLTRVPLAVLTLTALAAFEAVAVMPAAALQLGAARASSRGLGANIQGRRPLGSGNIQGRRPLGSGPRRAIASATTDTAVTAMAISSSCRGRARPAPDARATWPSFQIRVLRARIEMPA